MAFCQGGIAGMAAGAIISLPLVKTLNGHDYDEIIRMCSHFCQFTECYARYGQSFPPTSCSSSQWLFDSRLLFFGCY
ncbi:hypothetical protein MICAK_750012 [Microcystis aeruginosa PCC 9701]|uniref:Uncharacterized protein n=1 Tax=Microcystis aeruginosa PCC 9701 TaxID=721123 RepID=I4IXD6_MICAE|nr:hypothetical protein MICAK_750012 [Microcystis aeruginosa PCC 9701]